MSIVGFFVAFGIGVFGGSCLYIAVNHYCEVENSEEMCDTLQKRNFFSIFPYFLCIFFKKENHKKTVWNRLYFEIFFGFLSVLTLYQYSFGIQFMLQLFFWSMLILVGFVDYRTTYIYDRVLFFYGALFAIIFLIFQRHFLWNHFMGGLIGLLFFGVIYFCSKWYYGREAFGLGDVFLNGLIGFYFGMCNIIFVCCIPFYLAVIFLLLRKIAGHSISGKDEISFAPFMCLSAFLLSIIGEYHNLF